MNMRYIDWNTCNAISMIKITLFRTSPASYSNFGISYCNQVFYIHTEKYSPKSYVVNFRTQISSSQSEERTMVFTREKKWYVQSESRTMFFHAWEKWYVQAEATDVCEFRAKIPAFYCSSQRRFAHIQREKLYSKSFSH